MTKILDRDKDHKLFLDLRIELSFENSNGVQPDISAVAADQGENRKSVACGYRLIGVNVLEQSTGSKIPPFDLPARGAWLHTPVFEDLAESFEIVCSHP
jgi:hypothetical protein